jgi:hypothetical protein
MRPKALSTRNGLPSIVACQPSIHGRLKSSKAGPAPGFTIASVRKRVSVMPVIERG